MLLGCAVLWCVAQVLNGLYDDFMFVFGVCCCVVLCCFVLGCVVWCGVMLRVWYKNRMTISCLYLLFTVVLRCVCVVLHV